MLKLGHVNLETMIFPLLHIHMIGKARDDLYTAVSNFELGEPYCASFDLSPDTYAQFLDAMTPAQRAKTQVAHSQHPWNVFFDDDKPEITITAVYAGYKVQTEDETYVPLKITETRKHPILEKQGVT
jgi:hypothetical protein